MAATGPGRITAILHKYSPKASGKFSDFMRLSSKRKSNYLYFTL